ncbi:hypothetical protein, partial [Syntrophotalea acetylenica]|uniref:hypothetical protein n=1 Tax=Syntrophotalea acetylenica TaxID=29542 RepID=UPI002A362600
WMACLARRIRVSVTVCIVLKGRLRFLPGYLPEALAMCRRLKAEGTAEGLFLQHQQFFKKTG